MGEKHIDLDFKKCSVLYYVSRIGLVIIDNVECSIWSNKSLVIQDMNTAYNFSKIFFQRKLSVSHILISEARSRK